MKKMIAGALALLATLFLAWGLSAREDGKAGKEYQVRVEKDLMIPMRDRVKMATDIYFPVGLDQAPVILLRTPYGKKMMTSRKLPRKGYITIVQDVRGRYGSEGEFYPFLNDGEDGQDMIAWIQKQPWFNGKLGTAGASYLGTTQWFEAPGQDLGAMHLTVTSPDLKEVIYTDGEMHLMTIYFWGVATGEHKNNFWAAFNLARINRAIYTLPISKADDRAGRDIKYFNDALEPEKIFKTYEQISLDKKYQEIGAPAVLVAGWYDMFLGPQLSDFNRVLKEGKGNAKDSILVVGPWGHGKAGDGSVSYGDSAGQDDALGKDQGLVWFDRWLKGEDNQAAKWPKVRIFVMGENQWRDENEWPLKRTQYTNFYFHSAGTANTLKGDGALSMEKPSGSEPADKFRYDPLKPVPTKGGNSLGLNLGAYNQATLEKRKDVLCYTSAPLDKDLEVTGPIKAVLFAASDAVDTDFTVKLVDVYPDGRAINIQDGVVRAMYRDNDPLRPTPLTPGRVEQYDLDLWATSNVFKAGHRIRVEVSSSNFPRFNRNLNTGEPIPDATRTVVANQTVYHDSEHPSYIVLPVIPR